MSEDRLILAQQVSQQPTDYALLVPMVEALERTCGHRPVQISADSGFFVERQLASDGSRSTPTCPTLTWRMLNSGGRLKQHASYPANQRMRRKLRSPVGRAAYQRRKELAEPIIGVLKELRGIRQFRMRSLGKVAAEFRLAVTTLNLTRLWRLARNAASLRKSDRLL